MSMKMTSFLFLTVFGLAGCSPTYRSDKLPEQVKKIGRDEYNINAEVKLVGKTLSARVLVDNLMSVLLSSDSGEGKKAWDMMTVLSRVSLSTDAPVDFFVVVAADKQDPRSCFMFVRYVDDVKRVMLDDISRNEFFDGTLVELKLKGKTYFIDPSELDFLKVLLLAMGAEKGTAAVSPDEPWAEDVDFPDFLARAAAQRLKRILSENSRASSHFVVREVNGQYEPPNGRFLFRLDLVRKSSMDEAPEPETPGSSSGAIGSMFQAARVSLKNLNRKPPATLETDILPFSAGEMAKFLRRYHFKGFSSIEIDEINSGRSLAMPFH
jgi:hypothetical protein